jgi:hypothetical protein
MTAVPQTLDSASLKNRDRLLDLASGFEISQAIYALAKLGVADHLARGPRSVESLARLVDARPRPLFRLMRFLAHVGLLTQSESDQFGLTPLGEWLRSDVPGSARPAVISVNEAEYRAAGELLHTIRTGETGFDHLFGMGLFDYLSANPEAGAAFNARMAALPSKGDVLLSQFDFDSAQTVVDVGGGRGAVLATLLLAKPHLQGILADLPQVMAEADVFLRERGVRDRCTLAGGSILESVPVGGDVYLTSAVIHTFGDPDAAKVLRNIRAVMPRHGTLLLWEFVVPLGGEPSRSKVLDLRMLYASGGVERTEPEWVELLRKTGFRFERAASTGTVRPLVIARPA